jgi:putative salt-induced outer membrane protein YdiY
MCGRFFQLAILAIAAITTQVSADIVVMRNGDRITGEISQIWGSDVSIEPTYADEFDVDLGEVAYIESDREFDLTLDDGREVTAQLRGAGEDGRQVVIYDGETHSVAVTELSQVQEVDEYFDWGSHIDWNSTVSEGNTESRVARLAGDATVDVGDHRHITTFVIADEEVGGVKTKDQQWISYTYNWLFSDRWFLGAGASYETDPIKQLERRRIFGTGLGRDIWDSYDRTLSFEFGLGRLDESLAAVQETNTIAYWKFRFEYEFSGTDLDLYHNHQFNSYLSGRDNFFAKTSTGLRYEITDLLYLTMSYNVDYESDPPPGTEQRDSTWVVGAGFEF